MIHRGLAALDQADAVASGRTLREVAREHGVDEQTLDTALNLRTIAAGSKASPTPV
jgi:fumarate hydratase class II